MRSTIKLYGAELESYISLVPEYADRQPYSISSQKLIGPQFTGSAFVNRDVSVAMTSAEINESYWSITGEA